MADHAEWELSAYGFLVAQAGNVELKRQDIKSFQAAVLEVVNSDTQEIEQIEAAWKKKLLSRKFGLNKN